MGQGVSLRTIFVFYSNMRLWLVAKRFFDKARMHLVFSFLQEGIIKTASNIKKEYGKLGASKTNTRRGRSL